MASLDNLARAEHRAEDGDMAENRSVMVKDQLGILYGMAENEAIGELCTIVEEVRRCLCPRNG